MFYTFTMGTESKNVYKVNALITEFRKYVSEKTPKGALRLYRYWDGEKNVNSFDECLISKQDKNRTTINTRVAFLKTETI